MPSLATWPPRVPHFTPLALLGSGGEGETWLARPARRHSLLPASAPPPLPHHAALHLSGLPAINPLPGQVVLKFRLDNHYRRESRSTKLAHSILRRQSPALLAAGKHAGTAYLALQHLPGWPLDSCTLARLPHPPRSPARERWARAITCNLALALSRLHRAGLIHGDISEYNVLLRASPAGLPTSTALIDFGLLARIALDPAPAGTPDYCRPYRPNARAHPRHDLYALACLAHHLLFGRTPDNHPYPSSPAWLARLLAPRPPSALSTFRTLAKTFSFSRKLGAARGTILYMAPDFDAPLDQPSPLPHP